MSGIRRLLLTALPALLLGVAAARAAEFEVLDRFSVDGYSVFRGSSDIPGGSFAVGGSTFVVKNGNVGVGTAAPGASLHIISKNTVPTAFKVQTGSVSGTEVVISTSGNVGIGTTEPVVNLDVAGGIRVGNVTDCTGNKAGTIRWSGQHFEGCTGTAWRQFDNQPPPIISSVSPALGLVSGGTAITISGSGFNFGVGVLIGEVAATVTGVTGTQITATTSAGPPGAKDVTVTNLDGQYYVAGSAFTYNPLPTIAGVSPVSGRKLKTTAITITGTGFAAGASVKIGDETAAVSEITDTQIKATAPASSVNGAKTVKVTNPDTGSIELANGFTYKSFATGGVETDSGLYHLHTFTTAGSDSFILNFAADVEVLMVGGGAGGGFEMGGGGGAGGFFTGTLSLAAGTIPVSVGDGGAGRTSNSDNGGQGGDSVLGAKTVYGGGAGGNNTATYDGTATAGRPRSGGSGGGCGEGSGAPPVTAGEGNYGGNSYELGYHHSGGGGGAGSAGANASTNGGGNGGAGRLAFDGAYYAGGGGGGVYGSGSGAKIPGTGGSGGGGNAGAIGTVGSPGVNGKGGGGGGGSYSPSSAGGRGGSGIVIVRYLN